MPSGHEAYQRKSQKKAAQREAIESGGGAMGFTHDFRLKDKEFAVVRFLEQGEGLTFADTHRVPVQGKRGLYYKDFVCLDTRDDGTPCPACQHPNDEINKRISRGFVNLIWRQAPVFQRDEKQRPVKGADGRYVIVGREDQIALWKCSWTVFELLQEKDRKYRGLMSRDWEVKRTGSQMNDTTYYVEEADPGNAQPMLIVDLALADKKYDLAALTTPLSFPELAMIISRGALPPGQGAQPTMDRSAAYPTVQEAFSSGQQPQVRASAFTRG